MKTIIISLVGLLITALSPGPAAAWGHANAFGGRSSGGGGSWSHTGAFGGSASGGGGSWSGEGARGGTASGGEGSWSAKGAEGGHASGGEGSWSGTGAYGGHASGGDGHWSATNSYGTTAYHTTGYGTTAYGTTTYGNDGLLRRNLLRRVPSTHHRELLRKWVLQLRGLVHCRRSGRGCRGRHGRRRGRGFGQYQRSHFECLLRGLRRWQHVCDERDLPDAAGRLYPSHRRWRDLLPVQQCVVPAVLRRERRLLPCGARSLRRLARALLRAKPSTTTNHRRLQ